MALDHLSSTYGMVLYDVSRGRGGGYPFVRSFGYVFRVHGLDNGKKAFLL